MSEDIETADQIIQRCFADIKKCDLFVYLQTRRHGSRVAFPEADPTRATYLELELFAAALLRKPMVVLRERDSEPEPELEGLLNVLRSSFGDGMEFVDGAEGLLEAFRSEVVLRAIEARATVRTAGIPDALSALRSRPSFEEDFANPRLRFLGGHGPATGRPGDHDIASALVAQVASGLTPDGGIMSHGASVFRLWAAIRELRALDLHDPQAAILWDRVLGLWSRKVSWFGVHGHVYMGALAAANSQIDLRKEHRSAEVDTDSRPPLVAKASATYSVAGRMGTRAKAIHHYAEAAWLSKEAALSDAEGSSGALAVQGFSMFQLAKLKRSPDLLAKAKAAFREQLKRREGGVNEAEVGEAEFDLGFVSLVGVRPFAAFSLMQAGLDKMRTHGSADGLARLARVLRKFELVSLAFRPFSTLRTRAERKLVADLVDAQDQLRDTTG
jgi:hypothetical protein